MRVFNVLCHCEPISLRRYATIHEKLLNIVGIFAAAAAGAAQVRFSFIPGRGALLMTH